MSTHDPDEVREIMDDIAERSAQAPPPKTAEELRDDRAEVHRRLQAQATEARATILDALDGEPGMKPKGLRIVESCIAGGEPYFVFRAKDIFSVMAITEYLRIVEQYGPEDHEMQRGICQALAQFKEWQGQNVNLVRYPD